MSHRARAAIACAILSAATACHGRRAPARAATPSGEEAAPGRPPPEVLTLRGRSGHDRLPADRGAAALWQDLLALSTVASALHLTAHPDDEDAGTLTWLARGRGVRTALLSLTRGESGANAIGPELFDALGLVRAEELLQAGRVYGLSDQYLTPTSDFGYSKRLDETLERWSEEAVLADAVRVIRINRPFVVISRFRGDERDGHGNHQAAGRIATEAFRAAGDPTRFPEQLREGGLRTWQPRKLYQGGSRADEPWSVRVDTEAWSPWLGATFRSFGWAGWSLHRSQTGGRGAENGGAPEEYYRRVDERGAPIPGREGDFFDGIDTTLTGAIGQRAAPIERAVRDARAAFRMDDPAATVPPLLAGLRATRVARAALAADPDASFLLAIKETQLEDAIALALGLELTAVAVPPGATDPESSMAPMPTLGPLVPGQRIDVEARLSRPTRAGVAVRAVELAAPPAWTVERAASSDRVERFQVTVAADATPTRPLYRRDSIQDARYTAIDPALRFRPVPPALLEVRARIAVDGTEIRLSAPVETREDRFPDGVAWRALQVVPALSVRVLPEEGVILHSRSAPAPHVTVELTSYASTAQEADVALALPDGWRADPASARVALERAGARQTLSFELRPPAHPTGDQSIRAVATVAGHAYGEGLVPVGDGETQPRFLYRDATARLRAIDVTPPGRLRVGYVMGVGDEVPDAIRALGATVTLLDSAALARLSHRDLDAVVIGTRAYAVRPDLRVEHAHVLDYVRSGGNLVVLYQTPEFQPQELAPLPGELLPEPEEVSEENAAVEILAPTHRLMTWPNRIGPADFDGWVEQRGSKFWSKWDPGYTALLSSHDRGQPAQAGGLLTAQVGAGHYTYCGYALHRQLPHAVPGAWRLLANLLALGVAHPGVKL